MAEIIQCYREAVPAMRFIGRKYDGFTSWGECFSTDTFGAIERAMGGVEAVRALWKDGGYVGLERHCDGEPFAYYIGMFTPPDTPVPDGLCSVDFDEAYLGVCWFYGDGSYDPGACAARLEDAGFKIGKDAQGAVWSFQNCTCPRYTTPDEKGNIISDYAFILAS